MISQATWHLDTCLYWLDQYCMASHMLNLNAETESLPRAFGIRFGIRCSRRLPVKSFNLVATFTHIIIYTIYIPCIKNNSDISRLQDPKVLRRSQKYSLLSIVLAVIDYNDSLGRPFHTGLFCWGQHSSRLYTKGIGGCWSRSSASGTNCIRLSKNVRNHKVFTVTIPLSPECAASTSLRRSWSQSCENTLDQTLSEICGQVRHCDTDLKAKRSWQHPELRRCLRMITFQCS